MSELFLVRHAQASYGSDNYDKLSELGHQQSRWLGEFFRYRGHTFDQIVCGNMVRHKETLDGILDGMETSSRDKTVIPEWNEFDFETLIKTYLNVFPGQQPAPGARPADLMRVLEKTLRAWAEGSLGDSIPETWEQYEKRIQQALATTTRNNEQGTKILVVSSGGAISMAISRILKAPPASMIQMNLQVRNSSISHLYFNRSSLTLAGFNHVPHLEHTERSDAVTYY